MQDYLLGDEVVKSGEPNNTRVNEVMEGREKRIFDAVVDYRAGKQAPVRGLGTPNGGIVVFDKTSGEAMNIMPKSSAHVTLRCQDE